MLPLLLTIVVAASQPEPNKPYVVFDLSPFTSNEELGQRYPGSQHRDNFVWLSETEAHDGIGSVALTHAATFDEVNIGFHRGPRSHPIYPKCAPVRASIESLYGAFSATWQYYEEKMRSQAYLWKSGSFTLSLSCFYTETGELLAERLRSISERTRE